MTFYDLMFEVSNEDRVRILNELSAEPHTYSDLSRKLDITTQEVSRHVQRLTGNGLTTRRSDGLLELTPFGGLLLRQLSTLRFTSKHRDYFTEHVMDGLPDMFLSRIGELRDSTLITDVMVVIHRVQKVIEEAEEYLLNINMRYFSSGFEAIKGAYDREVKGCFLHGSGLQFPSEMMEDRRRVFPDGYIERVKGAGMYMERLLDVPMILYLSEKEVALVCFPGLDGVFDFRGFASKDAGTHQWSRDLFQYYWEKGKPVM
jgi:predicted transcriptional regulator